MLRFHRISPFQKSGSYGDGIQKLNQPGSILDFVGVCLIFNADDYNALWPHFRSFSQTDKGRPMDLFK
jgi:hypothetical protein